VPPPETKICVVSFHDAAKLEEQGKIPKHYGFFFALFEKKFCTYPFRPLNEAALFNSSIQKQRIF
jgi:hypothetical protein